MPRACFYVNGHGFGHASRVQAAVELLLEDPRWAADLVTSAPRVAFGDLLLHERCSYRRLELDPGVVQRNCFHHDVDATARAWESFLDGAPALIAAESELLRSAGTDVVVSDVSALACACANGAGLRCLVLGNFTWDWILEGYAQQEPRLARVAERVRALYTSAETYLRLPLSPETDLFPDQRRIGFLARRVRTTASAIRARLGIAAGELMVLLSFGGFGPSEIGLDRIEQRGRLRCAWDLPEQRPPGLISFAGAGYRYTDLVAAADVVLTKPGFSIIAESVAQRTLLAFVPRRGFRETPLLERFLRERWPAVELPFDALASGRWVDAVIEASAEEPAFPEIPADGDRQVCHAIAEEAP